MNVSTRDRTAVLGTAAFLTLLVAYFFVYFQRMTVSVVGDDIVGDVGGNTSTLNSVYFWVYAAMQIPAGLAADRWGPRASASAFMTIAAAGCLIITSSDTFELVAFGKALTAVGMAVVYIPLMKIASTWFPKSRFALLSGAAVAVGNLGAICAGGPLRMVADAIGWRGTFLAIGTVTLALAIVCFLIVRDDPVRAGVGRAGDEEDPADARVPTLKGLRAVFSGGRAFWPMAIGYFLVYGSIMVFQGTLARSYFKSVYDFVEFSAWLITMIGIGKIVSSFGIGALVSRGVIGSTRRALIAGTGSFLAVWVVILALAGDVDSTVFWSVVCILFGFTGGVMSLSFAQVRAWYPIAIAGTSVAGMNVFLFLGASVGTTISAAVVGNAYTLDNFTEMWAIMTAFAAAAFVLAIISKEKREEDPLIGADLLRGLPGTRAGIGFTSSGPGPRRTTGGACTPGRPSGPPFRRGGVRSCGTSRRRRGPS